MTALFRLLLALAGLAITGIAASNVLLGLHATGQAFEALLAPLIGPPPGFDGLAGRDADSELRFYATFFLAYGLTVLWLAACFPRQHRIIPPLLAVFFVGGVARCLSWAALGAPHPLFQGLLVVELTAPPLLWLMYRSVIARQGAK